MDITLERAKIRARSDEVIMKQNMKKKGASNIAVDKGRAYLEPCKWLKLAAQERAIKTRANKENEDNIKLGKAEISSSTLLKKNIADDMV